MLAGTEDVKLAQTGIERGVEILGDAGVFAFLVPFMLAIAVVYGLLEHWEVPKNEGTRSIIAILSGFLVLPLGNVLFPFLEGLALGFIVIVATVLALIIMAEATGIKQAGGEHIWEAHPNMTGIIFILIAIVIFLSAGGPRLIGLDQIRFSGSLGLAFFLVVIAAGVWWIAGETGE